MIVPVFGIFMRFPDLLGMSLSSLFKRKVRTVLTVLGVLIGTTSIVLMVGLGIGMKQTLLEEMESYGSLLAITVMLPDEYDSGNSKGEERHLGEEQVELLSHIEHVTSVDPVLDCTVFLFSGRYRAAWSIQGVTQEYLARQNIVLGAGHLPEKNGELELVYGNALLGYFHDQAKGNKTYWDSGVAPDIDLMHDQIYLIPDFQGYISFLHPERSDQPVKCPKKYLIPTAGVVEGAIEDNNPHAYALYCDIDALRELLQREFRGRAIPGQPLRRNGKPYREIFYTSLYVNVDQMDNVTMVQEQINDMGYQTDSSMEWIESDMKMMNIVQAVLGGIGAVSLFVAAIGITNTMMMSIYERTKEIGIMKVIGCRVRDIQTMFLMEAGFIGFIGGLLGVGLSYLLSMVINRVIAASGLGADLGAQLNNISRIPLWLGGISVVFAILVAMLAGLLPSIRAMKLSPLAAIREE